jgi:uncharacterized protein YdhG (YjbR/CyaY superfamily)
MPLKSAKSTAATSKKFKGFTDEEKAAMREHIQAQKGGEGGEDVVLAKIAGFSEPDRTMAKRIHAIIMASEPAPTPRLCYGMPAYAKDDKVVCFFQPAAKFKTRYATLGFSDKSNLDEGAMWPVAFALKGLTSSEEARIGTLVEKAAN